MKYPALHSHDGCTVQDILYGHNGRGFKKPFSEECLAVVQQRAASLACRADAILPPAAFASGQQDGAATSFFTSSIASCFVIIRTSITVSAPSRDPEAP